MRKRRIVLLGATGSIGESTRKVAEAHPDRVEIVGMATGRSAGKLAEAANQFRPSLLCLHDPAGLGELKSALEYEPRIVSGAEGLLEVATMEEADMALIAIVGTAGLAPALAAAKAGLDLAVASKEILVMAGEAVMQAAADAKVEVLPVDSEHNAIFQCLEGRPLDSIKKLILTASGGPFRKTPASEFATVRPEQALKHPTWVMGRKITLDSATLFNKGLEMIEARWLFGLPMDQVDVIVHPQSIVHSMVEFIDGSILAQLSHSDMCFPIQYAITWPDRIANSLRPLDFAELGKLEFERPRFEDFPALNLARQAGETGGTLPAVMNAANEIAAEAFFAGHLRFPGIWETVGAVMEAHTSIAHPTLDAILQADQWARTCAEELIAAVAPL